MYEESQEMDMAMEMELAVEHRNLPARQLSKAREI